MAEIAPNQTVKKLLEIIDNTSRTLDKNGTYVANKGTDLHCHHPR